MSRRPSRYTQAEMQKAIKAMQKAGEEPSIEFLPDGTTRIVPLRAVSPGDKKPTPAAAKRRISL